MEQEESRAVRTDRWLYIERFNKEGMDYLNAELYDLEKDQDERIKLTNEKDFIEYKKMLSEELSLYFNKFSIPKFDLWKGGSAKSNVSNPSFWKKAWGPNWNITFQSSSIFFEWVAIGNHSGNISRISFKTFSFLPSPITSISSFISDNFISPREN